jgi:hypothetical protein
LIIGQPNGLSAHQRSQERSVADAEFQEKADCRLVEQRPTSTTVTIVGGDKVYHTGTDAERNMTVVCKR